MKCGHRIITDGCKCCKKLQDKWYKKLDFEDAESTDYADRPLKVWHNSAFVRTSVLEIEITHDYYSQAIELLHSFHFANATHRRIWELHCDGLSRAQIEKAIKSMPNACKQSTIRNIIKDLERELDW